MMYIFFLINVEGEETIVVVLKQYIIYLNYEMESNFHLVHFCRNIYEPSLHHVNNKQVSV